MQFLFSWVFQTVYIQPRHLIFILMELLLCFQCANHHKQTRNKKQTIILILVWATFTVDFHLGVVVMRLLLAIAIEIPLLFYRDDDYTIHNNFFFFFRWFRSPFFDPFKLKSSIHLQPITMKVTITKYWIEVSIETDWLDWYEWNGVVWIFGNINCIQQHLSKRIACSWSEFWAVIRNLSYKMQARGVERGYHKKMARTSVKHEDLFPRPPITEIKETKLNV